MSEPEKAVGEMKRFMQDQVEAVRVARTEAEAPNHQRRLDACYLAMRFLDDLNGGTHGSHKVGDVIRTAREFEQYLAEP
jgi:hypothetical protein